MESKNYFNLKALVSTFLLCLSFPNSALSYVGDNGKAEKESKLTADSLQYQKILSSLTPEQLQKVEKGSFLNLGIAKLSLVEISDLDKKRIKDQLKNSLDFYLEYILSCKQEEVYSLNNLINKIKTQIKELEQDNKEVFINFSIHFKKIVANFKIFYVLDLSTYEFGGEQISITIPEHVLKRFIKK